MKHGFKKLKCEYVRDAQMTKFKFQPFKCFKDGEKEKGIELRKGEKGGGREIEGGKRDKEREKKRE